MKRIITFITVVCGAALLIFFLANNPNNQPYNGFDLGLDLAGGTQLTYQADISELETVDIQGSIAALRTVLERRLNSLGASDIKVTTESASVFSANDEQYYRVNIEIPGIFDAQEAKALIGKIPVLEFRFERQRADIDQIVDTAIADNPDQEREDIINNLGVTDIYEPTGLTGRYVENAILSNNPNTGQIAVLLQFNTDGAKIFADLTRDNVGRVMAIILDGEVISAPVIRATIVDGNAEITGQFTAAEASELVRNLKFGALPVPIELISTQSISPTLGSDIIDKGTWAGVYTLILVSVILIALYRVGGVIATVALSIYVLILLSYFKFTGTDMTAAGIAGFIITIGMAVDANILIFERIKEELSEDVSIHQSIQDGFARAWLSIRDGNLSSIIVACVLYFLTTSFVKGFALSFGIGIVVSMFTAIVITRSLLKATAIDSSTYKKYFLGSHK